MKYFSDISFTVRALIVFWFVKSIFYLHISNLYIPGISCTSAATSSDTSDLLLLNIEDKKTPRPGYSPTTAAP